ncbi:MAG: hypothetical protein OEZ65_16830 [Gemmatimonadota bacterium]|nr:hypothetical protein [Gemmatimonadota bacterium]MDH5761231.1 hypothetical protein [Gemmatimonadota bacterium]
MTKTRPLHFVLAAATALALHGTLVAQESPAAMVIRVRGAAQIRGAAGTVGAAVGIALHAGDEIVPDEGARVILLTSSGAQRVVTTPTTIAGANRADAAPGLFARTVRSLADAAASDTRTEAGRQGMIRPMPKEPTLMAPRNGLVVASERPSFRWLPVEGATGYTLQLREVDGGAPLRFPLPDVTTWVLPDTVPALIRGSTYAWTVAPTGGRPTREERFRVASEAEMSALGDALDGVRRLDLDPDDDGLFLATLAYRDLELYYDAAGALEKLEDSGQLNAGVYLLMGEIYARLGDTERARRAFDRADKLLR